MSASNLSVTATCGNQQFVLSLPPGTTVGALYAQLADVSKHAVQAMTIGSVFCRSDSQIPVATLLNRPGRPTAQINAVLGDPLETAAPEPEPEPVPGVQPIREPDGQQVGCLVGDMRAIPYQGRSSPSVSPSNPLITGVPTETQMHLLWEVESTPDLYDSLAQFTNNAADQGFFDIPVLRHAWLAAYEALGDTRSDEEIQAEGKRLLRESGMPIW